MSDPVLDVEVKPEVTTDTEGKPTAVTLDVPTYISLLVRANVTDQRLWPPQMQEGAEALARVRQIEAECIEKHGEFDWEKLPEDVQDEYDGLCVMLDMMQDTGDWLSWEEYKARRQAVEA